MKNMPPKKALSKHKIVQKQKIAARLIEISLKVDDYIYKKIPISVESAIIYREEIALFEPKCQGDDRSLQVIEKLTRFMKSIIEEQCKTNLENASQSSCNLLDTASNGPSALDSTIKSVSRSIQVQTDELGEVPELDSADNNKDGNIDKIKLTEKEKHVETNIEDDLEKTLSNLSLSIIDDFNKDININFDKVSTLKESINVKDSQCLDKPSTTNTIQETDITARFDNPIQGPKDHDKIWPTIDTMQYDRNNIIRNTQKQTHSMMSVDDIIMKLQENQSTCLSNISMPLNFSSLESQKNENTLHAFNIETSDKSNKLTVEAKNIKTNKNNNSNSLKNEEIKSTENERKLKSKPKKPVKRKNKVLNTENNLITENITQNKKKKSRVKNIKKTNFDLSWVQDIKYVRVIDHLEFDCNLNNLEDSFWNNSSLPSDCNEYF